MAAQAGDNVLADATGISDIPEAVRTGLLKDAESMLKGIVVSRARVLVEQLAGAGAGHNAKGLVNLAQQLSRAADKLDVTLMKQVLQQIRQLLSKKPDEKSEVKGLAAAERG